MGHPMGEDVDPTRSPGPTNVWCVVAHDLDVEPWWRFTVEAVGPDGPVRTHTVDTDEVTAALQVWLARIAQRRRR